MERLAVTRWVAGVALLLTGASVLVTLEAGAAHATPVDFTGTVQNAAGQPVASATVVFTSESGTSPTSVTLTSATDGSYAAALVEGLLYTVEATPPSGSTLLPLSYQHVQAHSYSPFLPIVLRTTTNTTTGRVEDGSGVGLPRQTVQIRDRFGTLASALTNDDGRYSLTAPSFDDYLLQVTGSKTVPDAYVPDGFARSEPLNLTTDSSMTIVVQAVTLTVHVREATTGNVPVAPATVYVQNNVTTAGFPSPVFPGTEHAGVGYPNGAQTDALGDVSVVLLANSTYTVSTNGSFVDGYGQAITNSTSIAAQNTAVTVALPTHRSTISGRISAVQSATGITYPVAGMRVQLADTATYRFTTTTTDANGDYSLGVPSGGGYRMFIDNAAAPQSGGVQMSPLPGTLTEQFSMDMSSDRRGDIVLPFDALYFQVVDSLGQSIPMPIRITAGADGTLPPPFTGAGTSTVSFSNRYDDLPVSGQFRPVLHGLSYTVEVSGVPGSAYGRTTLTGVQPTTDVHSVRIDNLMGRPSNLRADSPTPSAPLLRWDYPSGSDPYSAAQYRIYRNGALVGSSSTQTFTDSSITTSGDYSYEVSAVNSQGTEGERSSSLSVTYRSPAPAVPTGLMAATPAKQASLTWSSVPGTTSYRVYRDGTLLAGTANAGYTDATASNGTHTYTVTALNASGESGRSAPATVVIDTVRPALSFTSPSSFSSPFSTGPTVTISGSDSSGLQSMAIHVYTSANQLLTTCGSANAQQLAAGNMSCNLGSLPNGTYYIKAGAFDGAGNNTTINSGNFTISRS